MTDREKWLDANFINDDKVFMVDYNYCHKLNDENISFDDAYAYISDGSNDPDICSPDLYNNLLHRFFEKSDRDILKNAQQGQGNEYNRILARKPYSRKPIKFSSDYIGPSYAWIENIIYPDKKDEQEIRKRKERIVEVFKVSRTIGGHIMWQVGFTENPSFTINTARSGRGGFYDRIDWTLLLLQVFYDCLKEHNGYIELKYAFTAKLEEKLIKLDVCKNCVKLNLSFKVNGKKFLKLFDAFYRSRESLELFEDFKGFCDFFVLEGSFVRDSEVAELAPYFPIMPEKDCYDKYVDDSLDAIKFRNIAIGNRK